MRSDESYNIVFSEKTPIDVWPKIASILKTTDDALDRLRPSGSNVNEGFLKKWRQITSFLVVSKVLKKFDFSATELSNLNEESITTEEIECIWEFITINRPHALNKTNLRAKSFFIELCKEAAEVFSIANIDRVEKSKKYQIDATKKSADNDTKSQVKVDMRFALKVNDLLPPQPWKPGVNKIVIKKLGCTNKEYFSAVNMLIDEGLRDHQKDGVVYDSDGNVICFDKDRVDPDSLELLDEITSNIGFWAQL